MELYYYIYTRPENNSNQYPDPPESMDSVDFKLTQTPFIKDDSRDLMCYIESVEPNIQGILQSQEKFLWTKIPTIALATERCNDNITHSEWEEFTNDGTYVTDNRTYPDLDI